MRKLIVGRIDASIGFLSGCGAGPTALVYVQRKS